GPGRSRRGSGGGGTLGSTTAEFPSQTGREDPGADEQRHCSVLAVGPRHEGGSGATQKGVFDAAAAPMILEDVVSPASYSYDLVPNLLSPQGAFQGFQIRSCGHRMHLSCYRRYQRSQQHHLYLSELLLPCPYCHQPCNLLLVDAPPPAVARLQLQKLLTAHVLKKARAKRAVPQRSLGVSPSGPGDNTDAEDSGDGRGVVCREGRGQGDSREAAAPWHSPSSKPAGKGPVSSASRAVAGGPAPFSTGREGGEGEEGDVEGFSDSEEREALRPSPLSWKRTLERFVQRCEKLRTDRQRLVSLVHPSSRTLGQPSTPGAPLRLQSALLHTAAASELLHLCRASLRISPLHLPAPVLWSPSCTSLRTSPGTVRPAGATFAAGRFGFFSFSSSFAPDASGGDSGMARLSQALVGADAEGNVSVAGPPRGPLPLAVPAWGGLPTGLQGVAAPAPSVGPAETGSARESLAVDHGAAERSGDEAEACLGIESRFPGGSSVLGLHASEAPQQSLAAVGDEAPGRARTAAGEAGRRDALPRDPGASGPETLHSRQPPCQTSAVAAVPQEASLRRLSEAGQPAPGITALTSVAPPGEREDRPGVADAEHMGGPSEQQAGERERNEGGCLLWSPADVGRLFGQAASVAESPRFVGTWPRNDFVVHPLAVLSKLISDSVEQSEMTLRSQFNSGGQTLSSGQAQVLHGCYAVYLHLADELQHVAIGDTGVTAFDLYLHDLELLALFHCPLFPSPLAEPLSPAATAPVPSYVPDTSRTVERPSLFVHTESTPPQESPSLSSSSFSSSTSFAASPVSATRPRPAKLKWTFGGLLPSDACSYVDLVFSVSLLHPSTRFHLLSRLFLAFHALALRAKADEKADAAGRHLRAAIDAAEQGARAAECLLLGSGPASETDPERDTVASASRRGDMQTQGEDPPVDARRAWVSPARLPAGGAQDEGPGCEGRQRADELAVGDERRGGREGEGWLSLHTALRQIEEEIAAELGRDTLEQSGGVDRTEARGRREDGETSDVCSAGAGFQQGLPRERGGDEAGQETMADLSGSLSSRELSSFFSESRPETRTHSSPMCVDFPGGSPSNAEKTGKGPQRPSHQRAFLDVLELYVQLFFLSEVVAILWQWWDRVPFAHSSSSLDRPEAAAGDSTDGDGTAWQEIWRVLHERAKQQREARLSADKSSFCPPSSSSAASSSSSSSSSAVSQSLSHASPPGALSPAVSPPRGRKTLRVPASADTPVRSGELEPVADSEGRGAPAVSTGFAGIPAGPETARRREGHQGAEKSSKRRSTSRKAEEDEAEKGTGELGRRRRKRNCEEEGTGGPGAVDEEGERRRNEGTVSLTSVSTREEATGATGAQRGRREEEEKPGSEAGGESVNATPASLLLGREASERVTPGAEPGPLPLEETGWPHRKEEKREKIGETVVETRTNTRQSKACRDALDSQIFVTRWSQEVETERLEWEGDSAVLEETRQADGLSSSVWLEDLRLLGRRLPFPPRKEQLGASAWRVRFEEEHADAEESVDSEEEAGNAPCCDADPSRCLGGFRADERSAKDEERLLTKDYLLGVYAARTERAAELRGRAPAGRRTIPLSRVSLGGLRPSSLDCVTPPFGFLEGTCSGSVAGESGERRVDLEDEFHDQPTGQRSFDADVEGKEKRAGHIGLGEEERKNVICRLVEAGLVPWLRKVHLLAKVVCPSQPLPFDKVKTAYELLGPASASDAPVLRTPSVSSFFSSSHVSSVSLSELLPSSVDLYDPSEECEMLLESLPLPKSIRLFLFGEDDDMWGTGEREDSARQREDEGRCDPVISAALKLPSPTAWPSAVSEAHALRILLRESQFLCCLGSLPPCSTSMTPLMPIVVSSRCGHETLVRVFQTAMCLALSEKSGDSVPVPSTSRAQATASPPSPFFSRLLAVGARGLGASAGALCGSGRRVRRERENEERQESVDFLNRHMLYFSPLARRLLPGDLDNLLASSNMKCTLLFSTVMGDADDGDEETTFTVVCVAQFLPHATILPKLYQQFYNHFLQLGAYTPSVGLHATPACAVCVTCGAFLCALDCCDARVPLQDGTQPPNLVLNLRRHATTCGMGLALYLHLSASAVYAAAVDTAVDRDAKWGCLHLDAYGEEDPLLKRGKPLHLSLNRLGRLTEDWRQHQIRLLRRLQWSRMDSSANNHAAQGM
ncbi:zinc finger in N-recognin protein, partial [Toxoplasma gondii ARI]